MVLASCAALAQDAPAALSFEAASLKPAASPGSEGRMMRRMRGGPGTTDPGAFTFDNVTLKLLVEMAYNLKEFQVEGPDWIDDLGFDLIAKIPPGTTKDQASQMMQTLLAERFKLVFHRETRKMPVFALVVGKSGSRMKEVDSPAPVPEGPPAGGPPRAGAGPGIRMTMSPDGIRMAGQMTMAQLADQLTRRMARPVLDETELNKTYDVDITWMPDDAEQAGMSMRTRTGGGPGGPGGDGLRAGGSEPALTLAQALEEKLGLKLEARKRSAEMFIIDRAEKVPVEN
jgi:uncharacterized protein (TIGR03435 family)